MTKMTGPDCAVMCNLINTHTHTAYACGGVACGGVACGGVCACVCVFFFFLVCVCVCVCGLNS